MKLELVSQWTVSRVAVWMARISAVAALVVSTAYSKETGEFQAPSLEGYKLTEIKMVDNSEPEDGVNESKLEIYKKNNSIIGRYTTNGKLYAIAVSHNYHNKQDKVNNYVIRDSACRGIFDERLGLWDELFVPKCIGVK